MRRSLRGVYTGGIDPFLWRPTPGVETLNFVPYRLDLTPFAGLLSDGAQHSVSVRVLGANHYFSVAAALLVYQDSKAKETGGAVMRNTLRGASLEPTITSTLGKDPSKMNGDVKTRAKQSYVIQGYVNTSGGRVRTRVEQSLSFANTQAFSTVSAQSNRHVTEQAAHAESTSSSTGGSSNGRTLTSTLEYSLTVNVLRFNHGSNRGRGVHLQQNFAKHIEQRQNGRPPYQASIRNTRTTSDQLTYSGEHAHAGEFHNTGQNSSQTFAFTDSLGNCYRAEVKALSGKVSSFTEGQGCGAKPMQWFVHPKGWPESFGWRENEPR